MLQGIALLLLAGCASMPASQGVSFVVVRHAEKAADDPRDPTLTEAGTARARALAERLRGERVVAAYATAYRRTQMTASPTARAAGIAITTYDANLPAPVFATRLRAAHRAGTVLVVGHSNTVPAIAAALCACDVAPMGEDAYDRLYRIDVAPGGRAQLNASGY